MDLEREMSGVLHVYEIETLFMHGFGVSMFAEKTLDIILIRAKYTFYLSGLAFSKHFPGEWFHSIRLQVLADEAFCRRFVKKYTYYRYFQNRGRALSNLWGRFLTANTPHFQFAV